tara:strand:+ start:184 stop:393 length:210 start_codon:yes stop_codon:yes gene_type:complete
MEAGNLLREYEISSEPELFGVFFVTSVGPHFVKVITIYDKDGMWQPSERVTFTHRDFKSRGKQWKWEVR